MSSAKVVHIKPDCVFRICFPVSAVCRLRFCCVPPPFLLCGASVSAVCRLRFCCVAPPFLLCGASVSTLWRLSLLCRRLSLRSAGASLSALHAPIPAAVRLGARHLHGSGAAERWSGGVTEQQDHRAIE